MSISEKAVEDLVIYQLLRNTVSAMKQHDKYCILIFEEFILPAFKKFDCPTHMYSFFLRGLYQKWKTPIVNCLLRPHQRNPECVFKVIRDAIQNILNTGLIVVATVSNHEKLNIDAIQIFRDESKDFLTKLNKFTDKYDETYVVNGHIIHHIYDPCRLLKSVRDNFKDKDVLFKLDGKVRRAQWKAVLRTFSVDKGKKKNNALKKISFNHLCISNADMTITEYAAQTLSETFGTTMLNCTDDPDSSPTDLEDTGHFIIFFDKLFDSCNAEGDYQDMNKPLRSPIKSDSPHFKFWDEALPVLSKMRFINKANGMIQRHQTVEKWACTIKGFRNIWESIRKAKIKLLDTRLFNADSLLNMVTVLTRFYNKVPSQFCAYSHGPILDQDFTHLILGTKYGYYEVADT